jgi:hypothetical protein
LPGTKSQEEGEAGRQRVRPGPHGHQARIPAWALVHVAVMGLGLPLSARGLTGDLVVERRRRAGLSRPMLRASSQQGQNDEYWNDRSHSPSSCLAERRSRYATRSPGLVLGSREDRRHPKGPAVYVPRAATTRLPPPLGREAPGLVAQWPSWNRPHETAQWSWPRTGRIDVALVAALDNLLPCLRTIRSEATNGEDQIIAGDNVL